MAIIRESYTYNCNGVVQTTRVITTTYRHINY